MRRINIANAASSVVLILCLVTSIFCYTRIHLKIRHQQAQVQNNVPDGQQNGEGIPLNIARYKKTVSSISKHYVGAVGISCLLCSVGHYSCATCKWNLR